MTKKYLETKGTSLESSILGMWQEAAGSKKDEELSKKQKKLDVDGDGEIEASDLAKLRKKGAKKEGLESSPNKANSQHLCAKNVVHEEWGEGQPVHGMHSEPDEEGNIAWYDVMFEHGIEKGVSINELKVTVEASHENHNKDDDGKKMLSAGKMAQMHQMMKDKKSAEEIAKAMKLDLKTVKALMSNYNMEEVEESYEIGTDEYRKHTQEITPGQEITDYQRFKVESMKEALAKVWGLDESKKEEKSLTKEVKGGKTMTGKKVNEIDVNPKIEGDKEK